MLPWGKYKVLHKAEEYVVKELYIYPGQRTSLQYHNFREEYWIVVHGEGIATVGEKKIKIKKGDFVKVNRKEIHRVENVSKDDILVIVEVWIGDKLDEKDIVRLQDDYEHLRFPGMKAPIEDIEKKVVL